MKKYKLALRDYTLSIFNAGMIGFIIMMVIIPLCVHFIVRRFGADTSFSVYTNLSIMGHTLDIVSSILVITHIVLGALVLQYMRLYMFMGLNRDRAFGKMVIVEILSLVFSFIFLIICGTISRLVSGNFNFTILLRDTFLSITLCSFCFGIGCMSSALSTTCRPPLSIGVIAVSIIAISWLQDKLTSNYELVIEEMDNFVFSYSSAPIEEALVTLAFSVLTMVIAYIVYKLPISQMKSTSLS